MALFRSYPVEKIVNGFRVNTSESVIVTHSGYETNGESSIVVKGSTDQEMILTLNKETTDHLTIKSMCNLLIRSEYLIDEEYGEIQLDKFSSVELKFIGENWYILSSDGLKNS